jgi:hypothetical protein
MDGTARIWFTPQQRAELWERWKEGRTVAIETRFSEGSLDRAREIAAEFVRLPVRAAGSDSHGCDHFLAQSRGASTTDQCLFSGAKQT